MKTISKLLFFLIVGAITLNYSCKKTEGCTDSTALNYDKESEKDDGSCTYENTENANNSGSNNSGGGDGTNGGESGGGTTNNGSTIADNTFKDGAVTFDLRDVNISTSGSLTTITVNKKGEANPVITIKINGDLPDSKKTYAIYDPFREAGSAGLTIESNGKTWVPNDALGQTNGVGLITIEPLGNESYKFYFGDITLGNSNISPSNTQTFGANFTLKYYQGEFSLNSDASLSAPNATTTNVLCSKSGSSTYVNVTGSSASSSGSMKITLPSSVSSKTYDITTSEVELSMTIDFVNYEEDNVTAPEDFWGSRDIAVKVEGKTLSYDFHCCTVT